MAKAKKEFICQNCGAVSAKWSGKCMACGEWDSLTERPNVPGMDTGRPAAGEDDVVAMALADIPPAKVPRLLSGLQEFDRVLGGGLVPASAVLLAGDPGIGKSTLMLQVAELLCSNGHQALYISSEESAQQVRMRAERLGLDGSQLQVASLSSLPHILHLIYKMKPAVAVIDSVQMLYKPTLTAASGSLAQLRHCGTELVLAGKQLNCATVLVGHVTKAGTIAGPKILEHLVDVVLSFEGDRYQTLRLVRSVKNRFGSTEELGVFEMTDKGMNPVDNPSAIFLESTGQNRPGSIVTSAAEGSRILLLEIQALCVQSILGAARRRVTGLDGGRVAMILAVLERHAGLRLADQDVFANVVGGVKVDEPAADLATALAVASAVKDRPIAPGTVVIGEVGLAGEVRPVNRWRLRVAEAARLGFKTVIGPGAPEAGSKKSMSFLQVRTVAEALQKARLV
jgi:DNA repair protein RadA/Sms